MKDAGVEVEEGVLEKACRHLNRRFFTFHELKRPYILLKWASTADGFMALPGPAQLKITGAFADRLVHKWRSREAAILVGAGTAVADNPALTNRLWSGASPVRILLDPRLRVPEDLKLFDGSVPTCIFNTRKDGKSGSAEWIRVSPADFLPQVLAALHDRDILSVMVEGGAHTLQAFINVGLCDEARVITGCVVTGEVMRAPELKGFSPVRTMEVEGDRVRFFEKA
jgi:diaminohydroxyphosphoribosylaminopyrimidine deaminase/5-amino-6-(5-phosphoribosylamino)uracil reductase